MIITDDDRRARAEAELRRGAPVVLIGETSAALIFAAESASDGLIRSLSSLPLRAPVVAVTASRATTLNARAYDGDIARIHLPRNAQARSLRAIADPALDLSEPLRGPYFTERDGSAGLHRDAIRLCKQAKLLPAAYVAPFLSLEEAQAAVRSEDLVSAPSPLAPPVAARWIETASGRVPIIDAPDAVLRVFRRSGWDDEHYALEIGAPDRKAPVLTRLHSACATGDLFGSLKCDCGPQLQAALRQITTDGAGVLLYLMQEGRGIGLPNKLRAYRLQDEGFDTVEANHRLGFEDDERLLTDGGEILHALGFRKARVLTNNPKKLDALRAAGIEPVERKPLIVGLTAENRDYLRVKAEKSGHLL